MWMFSVLYFYLYAAEKTFIDIDDLLTPWKKCLSEGLWIALLHKCIFFTHFQHVSLNDFFAVVSKYQKSKYFLNTICFPSRNLLSNLKLFSFCMLLYVFENHIKFVSGANWFVCQNEVLNIEEEWCYKLSLYLILFCTIYGSCSKQFL